MCLFSYSFTDIEWGRFPHFLAIIRRAECLAFSYHVNCGYFLPVFVFRFCLKETFKMLNIYFTKYGNVFLWVICFESLPHLKEIHIYIVLILGTSSSFETRSYYVAQASLKLMISLPCTGVAGSITPSPLIVSMLLYQTPQIGGMDRPYQVLHHSC